jgi:hypothetical protein
MEIFALIFICGFFLFLLIYTGIASKGIIDIAMGKKPVFGLPKTATKNKLSDDVEKSGLHPDLEDAPGIRDLLEEGRDDEAVDIYQKFAGVDEYTARAMVERIKRDLGDT